MIKRLLLENLSRVPLLVPGPLRRQLLSSPISQHFRKWYKSMLPLDAVQRVKLGGPLEGHQMLINLQMGKAFMYGTFEPELCKTITSIVKTGWSCMDIGANAGYFSLLPSKQVGASGKVYAFEPLPQIFDYLKQSIAINDYESRVTCECLALSDQTGTSIFTYRSEALTGGGSLVVDQPVGVSSEIIQTQVKTIRGDEYLADASLIKPIDFIKIDVEGAEGLVLSGLKATLANNHPTVLIEMHNTPGSSAPMVRPMLDALGYEQSWIDESHLLGVH